MNKITKTASIFLLAVLAIFASCSDSDNNNDYEVSDGWKTYQANLVTRMQTMLDESNNKVYTQVKSLSGLGSVYYKTAGVDYITKHMEEADFNAEKPSAFALTATKEIITKPLYDTDRVVVRYEGWFYDENDEKRIVFDSTEIDVTTGKSLNNNSKSEFAVNGVIDGFKTILLNMEVGQERVVCIPYTLAYGIYGSSQGTIGIPGYTTLFFDIKLLEVKRD